MPRPVVLITRGSYFAPGWIEDHWPQMLERCEIRLTDRKEGPEFLAELAEADVLLPRGTTVTAEMLDGNRRLRGIVAGGVGVEKIDIEAATEHGIVVANSPGNYPAVAEAAMLLVGALSKRMPGWIEAARTGK